MVMKNAVNNTHGPGFAVALAIAVLFNASFVAALHYGFTHSAEVAVTKYGSGIKVAHLGTLPTVNVYGKSHS